MDWISWFSEVILQDLNSNEERINIRHVSLNYGLNIEVVAANKKKL